MEQRIHTEHERAALYALEARHWFYHGRCALSAGDMVSAAFAATAWQRKWDIAERHSDTASKLEAQRGSVFPGVLS